MKLIVNIELSGRMTKVGEINYTDLNNAVFCYDKNYLANQYSSPISISLPLGENQFTPELTRFFFEALLPEGFTRKSVAQRLKIAPDNYLDMLEALGQECIGAIQIVKESYEHIDNYQELDLTEIKQLAAEGAQKSANIVTSSHLSLAGASGKVGLYFDKDNQKWFLPHGLAPSTHIVKQSHVRFNHLVVNEQLVMTTATLLGLNVAKSFIVNTANWRDEDILFGIERYDRIFSNNSREINGLKVPFRLHQEDFCQALGISSLQKYEPDEDYYLPKMFALLRSYSTRPIEDELQLLDLLIFNCLVGNCDCHLKNFALLYSDNLQNIRLSPAYDMVSTVIYETGLATMAYKIGGTNKLNEINAASFGDLGAQIGIQPKICEKHFKDLTGKFNKALTEAAKILSDSGCHYATEIKDRILQWRATL